MSVCIAFRTVLFRIEIRDVFLSSGLLDDDFSQMSLFEVGQGAGKLSRHSNRDIVHTYNLDV